MTAYRPSRLVVVLSNGTVATSTITSHTASGGDEPLREDVSVILTVSVDEEEHEGEAELGGDVKDTVGDDLGVDRDLVGSLGQSPDDGVSGPEDNGHQGEEPEESPGLASPVLGCGSTASDQDVPNEKESDTRDGVPSPLVPLTLVVGRSSDTGKETSDDHEDIGKDGKEGGSGGQTREDTERD